MTINKNNKSLLKHKREIERKLAFNDLAQQISKILNWAKNNIKDSSMLEMYLKYAVNLADIYSFVENNSKKEVKSKLKKWPSGDLDLIPDSVHVWLNAGNI